MQKTVSLNPGESKEVSFTFTPSVAKSYSVSVNGLSGTFVAIEHPEAEFVVSGLIITPDQVYIGQPVSISVVVSNTGGTAGIYELVCEVL